MTLRLLSQGKQVKNTKGKIFYGVHMYPGVSEFENDGDISRLFISDDTIRKMGPSFAGAPVYLFHKKPTGTIDNVRLEADGSVIESFFNEADGQHWVKFIVNSTRAMNAIAKGHGLSNGYDIKNEGPGGDRNGVEYDSEVLDGEFHHLAIVPTPRYESMILTPEEFKQYNDEKRAELKRVANSKSKKGKPMAKLGQKSKGRVSLFTKKPVENSKSKELEALSVLLPKSGREVSVKDAILLADKHVFNKGKPRVCNADDLVTLEDEGEQKQVSVSDLIKYINEIEERIEELEEGVVQAMDDEDEVENEDDEDYSEEVDEEIEEDVAEVENEDDEDDEDDGDVENEDDDEEEEEKPKPKVKNKDKKGVKNEKEEKPAVFKLRKGSKKEVKNSKKDLKAKKKADRARTANERNGVTNSAGSEVMAFAADTTLHQLERGRNRYGSPSK